MRPCPECNWEGATPAMAGWVYDPTNPNANEEGLVKCEECDGQGVIDDDE
jgi:hypothetical protein